MWWHHTADNKGIVTEQTQVVNKSKTSSNDAFVFVSTLVKQYSHSFNSIGLQTRSPAHRMTQ